MKMKKKKLEKPIKLSFVQFCEQRGIYGCLALRTEKMLVLKKEYESYCKVYEEM